MRFQNFDFWRNGGWPSWSLMSKSLHLAAVILEIFGILKNSFVNCIITYGTFENWSFAFVQLSRNSSLSLKRNMRTSQLIRLFFGGCPGVVVRPMWCLFQ